MKSSILFLLFALIFSSGCNSQSTTKQIIEMSPDNTSSNPYYSRTDTTHLQVSDAEWQKILSPAVYEVSRRKGTERAFTGKYWDFEGLGKYYCAVCGNALFTSDAKFGSSCGWPSFYETLRPSSVRYVKDNSYGMQRIEVVCGRCDGHLGHIFDDGPAPTFKRFCMNSVVLDFEPNK